MQIDYFKLKLMSSYGTLSFTVFIFILINFFRKIKRIWKQKPANKIWFEILENMYMYM